MKFITSSNFWRSFFYLQLNHKQQSTKITIQICNYNVELEKFEKHNRVEISCQLHTMWIKCIDNCICINNDRHFLIIMKIIQRNKTLYSILTWLRVGRFYKKKHIWNKKSCSCNWNVLLQLQIGRSEKKPMSWQNQ